MSGEAPQPLRLGVAGCRLARHRYGLALRAQQGMRLAALADEDATALKVLARELGGKPAARPDIEQMAADCELDALIIAVPTAHRAAAVRAAHGAGLPALCEAPLTHSLSVMDALCSASPAVTPSFFRRVDPWFRLALQVIEGGAIGPVEQARAFVSYPVGGVATLESGADATEGWPALVSHIAAHTVDVCRWWLGEAVTVSADLDLPDGPVPAGTGGGRRGAKPAIANFIVSHGAASSTHHLVQSSAQRAEERYSVTGTRGVLHLVIAAGDRSDTDEPLLFIDHASGETERLTAPTDPAYADLPRTSRRTLRFLAAFEQWVRTGSHQPAALEDARKSLEIVRGAFLASREQMRVSLPPRRGD